jgi:transient receptor potential cation channel subfamily M protein 2
MIRRMLKELVFFLLIMLVFIFAYGISTQSLMYHNQALDLSLIKNIFFGSFFVIGGEYFEREKLMDGKQINKVLLYEKIIKIPQFILDFI